MRSMTTPLDDMLTSGPSVTGELFITITIELFRSGMVVVNKTYDWTPFDVVARWGEHELINR
jgi:hypothetical protein